MCAFSSSLYCGGIESAKLYRPDFPEIIHTLFFGWVSENFLGGTSESTQTKANSKKNPDPLKRESVGRSKASTPSQSSPAMDLRTLQSLEKKNPGREN